MPKKERSIEELEREHKELLESLNPTAGDAPGPAPGNLKAADAGFIRSLIAGLELQAEQAACVPETQRFVTEVVQRSPEGKRTALQEDIDLLTRTRDTGADQIRRCSYGMVEAVFPVRMQGKVVYYLSSGKLRDKPFTDDELKKLAKASGLSASDVRWRAERVPIQSDEQIDNILSLYRRMRDSMEQALGHYVRTRELTGQLIQSERNRSLGTLSAGIAHHFNNLLSVILGYSSFVLNRETLSKDATRALQKITDAAQRGRRLTEELLAFSSGTDVEEEQLCHVHETIESVLSLLSSQAPPSTKIVTQAHAERDDVLAPPSSIHQVMFNLLTNAFDSMPQGGELTVTTSNTQIEGEGGATDDYLRIEVADTSGTLPAGFTHAGVEQVAPEAPLAGDTMGLKLSSVYGIVGRLDGTVLLSSTPGTATRVEILLPLAPEAEGPPIEKQIRRRLAPSSIWVVDDDPTFREMCRVVLTEEGHHVEQMAGGKEMQDNWLKAKTPPDLIIIDFSMPDYNGLELCDWLTKHGSAVPVVLVSGLSPKQPDIHRALERRKTYFLQKPFSFREMSDIVTVAMGETLIGE